MVLRSAVEILPTLVGTEYVAAVPPTSTNTFNRAWDPCYFSDLGGAYRFETVT